MLSIDVVIPTYNGWELTESCLRHLQQQAVPHRVIVSDNASRDGTPTHIRRSWPEATLVETGGNLGFAVACNRGAMAGEGDVIVLLNNDVDARPDFLEKLIAPLEADERVGSVAALLLVPGEELIDSIGLAADPTLSGFPRLAGRPASQAGTEQPTVVGPSGGAAAYRRTAWEEVGGLDEAIFIYSEDLDLALRLRGAGWEARTAPDAVGVHLGSATMVHRSSFQREKGGWARGYLLRRYGLLGSRAGPRALLTEALVVVGDAVISRDLTALRSRISGWKAGASKPRHAPPPREAIAREITLRESIRLRRGVYSGAG